MIITSTRSVPVSPLHRSTWGFVDEQGDLTERVGGPVGWRIRDANPNLQVAVTIDETLDMRRRAVAQTVGPTGEHCVRVGHCRAGPRED